MPRRNSPSFLCKGQCKAGGTRSGKRGGRIAIAEALGNRRLQVKNQPVFAPTRNQVQARSYQAEQRFVGLDLPYFKSRGQAAFRQLVPGFTQAGGAGHP